MLNRGNRFGVQRRYDGDHMAQVAGVSPHRRAAKAKIFTGKAFDGLPFYSDPVNSMGEKIVDDGYDLKLITFKEAFASQSRTPGTYQTRFRRTTCRAEARSDGLDGDRYRDQSRSRTERSISATA